MTKKVLTPEEIYSLINKEFEDAKDELILKLVPVLGEYVPKVQLMALSSLIEKISKNL